MPSYQSKMEYVQSIYQRYTHAAKEEKSRILGEVCRVCGYNRQYAIRLLSGPAPGQKKKITRARKPLYSQAALSLITEIWKATGHLCGQRLKAAIPLWLPYARKHFLISPQVEKEMLSISPRQIDNRLKMRKQQLKKTLYTTTRPGALLKHQIPLRTHNWDIQRPGFLEIDLVAHCGNSLSGQFIYTLTATDIRTGWTERVAVMGKGQKGVLDGLLDIKNALPFRLRGIDSDNGEE